MENYLLELIRENNRIIIPNFGAFIVSRDKGQNILFNNFLSFNDGLLISHICAVEGIDSAKATQKVEDYVAELNRSLDEGGVFEVKGIGRFLKDDQGVLRFEQTLAVDELEAEADLPEEVSLDDNDLLDLDTSIAADKGSEAGSASDSAPRHTSIESSVPTPPVSQGGDERDLATEDLTETGSKKRRAHGGWIFLLVLIALLLVGAALWFYTPVLDAYKPEISTQEEIMDEVVLPEEAPVDSSDLVLPVPEEEVQESAASASPVLSSTRQHHVIVGSYREEARATEAARRLVEKGYQQTAVLPYEDRFLVSVEWHASVNQALKRQEVLLQEMQMENWVLSLRIQ